MKRVPRNVIYRLDHFRHAMNPGKEARVRALLRVWREVAVLESRYQWRRFFETGGFEVSGPARFGHLVMAYQHQMIRDQVVEQLEGWIRSRQQEFTRLVARSNLDEALRHQLHTVNRWKAWFSRGPVQMKDGTPVSEEARVLARRIMRQIMSRHRRPSFKRIGMRIDVRGVKIQQARTSRAFSLWLRLMTTTRGQRIEVPLLPNRYALQRQGVFRNTIQVTEREDGTLVFGLAKDVSGTYQRQREAYQPATEQIALDFGLRTLFATDRGDLLGRGFMAHLAKLDRRITARAAHLQRMGRRPSSSKRYRRDVQKLRGFIRSEVNRVLNRIIERDRPAHLVLERLNFRAPGLSRRMNRLLQNCGRAVVRQKLQDLEEKYGVTATTVNAAYSSQECSACGYVDVRNRDGERFRCLWCERRIHADVNAARIIGRRRSSSIGSEAPVTKAGVLQEVVRRFLERHPRPKQGRSGPEGRPADPRWTNPYFKEWCASVTSMLPTRAAPLHGAARQ